jgi:hypothetical protein
MALAKANLKGRATAERKIEHESSQKVLASQLWPGYAIDTGTVQNGDPG